MSIEFDFSEFRAYTVDVQDASRKLERNVERAVKTSVFRGRKAWMAAATAKAGVHLPAYPASIDYDDVMNAGGVISTKLGPNLDRPQGPLGIVEDAPGGVRAAPQRNDEAAEKVIEKDLVEGVLKAVDDAYGGTS